MDIDTLIIIGCLCFFIVLFFAVYIVRSDKVKEPDIKLNLSLIINHIKIKGEIVMVEITSTQFLEGILQPTNRLGHAAPIQPGTVKFLNDNEDAVSIEVDPDHETKLKIVAKAAGVATVSFEADADLGDGVNTIRGSVVISVVDAAATGFGGINFGAPQEQPGLATDNGENGGAGTGAAPVTDAGASQGTGTPGADQQGSDAGNGGAAQGENTGTASAENAANNGGTSAAGTGTATT